MSQSSVQSQGSFVVLVEFLAVLGFFSFLLLALTHKEKVFGFFRGLFHLSRQSSTPLNKPEVNKQPITPVSRDLERGDLQAPGEVAGQLMDSSSLARVLDYLHGLPSEDEDYVTIREVSICSQEGLEEESGCTSTVGHGDGGGTVESLESNWVEIIHNFPVPPGPSFFRRLLEERQLTGLGLSGVDTGDVARVEPSEPRTLLERTSPNANCQRDATSPGSDNRSSSTIRPSVTSNSSCRAVES